MDSHADNLWQMDLRITLEKQLQSNVWNIFASNKWEVYNTGMPFNGMYEAH